MTFTNSRAEPGPQSWEIEWDGGWCYVTIPDRDRHGHFRTVYQGPDLYTALDLVDWLRAKGHDPDLDLSPSAQHRLTELVRERHREDR